MGDFWGYDKSINEFGFAVYSTIVTEESVVDNITQVFENGEIWGIDAYSLMPEGSPGNAPIPHFEKEFEFALNSYRSCLIKNLGVDPPIRFIAGMSGLKKREIELPQTKAGGRTVRAAKGHCVKNEVSYEGELDAETPERQALFPFFQKVYKACGLDPYKHNDWQSPPV
ncbi:MAG: hypothetical protein AAGA63_08605 [Pseudomonadota bacterium]